MSSAKASPADGPPTPPASILIWTGSLTFRLSRAETPTSARFGSCGSATVLIADRHPLAVADERDPHDVAGPVLGEHRAQVGDGGDLVAVRRHDHVARAEDLGRRRALLDEHDRHAAAGGLHLVAEVVERDDGGDLLRLGHVLHADLLLDRRADRRRRHERRAAWTDERQEPLEQARLALADVDEVDRPGLRRTRVVGDADDRIDGMRGVDEPDVGAVCRAAARARTPQRRGGRGRPRRAAPV